MVPAVVVPSARQLSAGWAKGERGLLQGQASSGISLPEAILVVGQAAMCPASRQDAPGWLAASSTSTAAATGTLPRWACSCSCCSAECGMRFASCFGTSSCGRCAAQLVYSLMLL